MPRKTREQAIDEYRDFFADCERLYETKANPLYAWWAIHTVTGLDYEPPLPMPGWCQQFLGEHTAALMRLVFDQALSPQERADRASAIFAMTTQGRNFIREFESDARNSRTAGALAAMKGRGDQVKNAVADLAIAHGVKLSTIFDRVRDVPELNFMAKVPKP